MTSGQPTSSRVGAGRTYYAEIMTIDNFRCKSCGKLLAEVTTSGTVIKCARCKLVNEVKQTA